MNKKTLQVTYIQIQLADIYIYGKSPYFTFTYNTFYLNNTFQVSRDFPPSFV